MRLDRNRIDWFTLLRAGSYLLFDPPIRLSKSLAQPDGRLPAKAFQNH